MLIPARDCQFHALDFQFHALECLFRLATANSTLSTADFIGFQSQNGPAHSCRMAAGWLPDGSICLGALLGKLGLGSF